MKMYIVVVLAVLAMAAAAPADLATDVKKVAELLESSYEKNVDGSYKSSFKVDNGIEKYEEGQLKEVIDDENVPHTVVVVRGTFTAIDKDGKPSLMTYEADENGFRITGDLIPKEATSA